MKSELHALRDLAARLPFDIDDADQANAAFQCWVEHRQDAAKRTVDLWTYCYVFKYYLAKFARERSYQVSDFDKLVADTYKNIEAHVAAVEDPGRYAQWVSKICKNTFINYIRSPRRFAPLVDAERHPAESAPVRRVDSAILYQVIGAAVTRLPDFLQNVARLVFVERRSYEEIEQLTGKPIPVIRSYASKARARFRRDRQLRASIEPLREELLGG